MMLDRMFSPRSIVVVGASRDSKKVGSRVLSNLLSSGFVGKVTVVNPKADEIMGVPSVPSILDIDGDIDLVIIAVPSRAVKGVLLDCEKKGVPAVIIISAGFREEGIEGRRMEAQLEEIVSRSGMRVVGPNCFGIMDSRSKMNATFTHLWPGEGNVALISQSGAVGATVLDWMIKMDLGLSRFASLGNKIDVDETDMLYFLAEDEDTEVIAIYLEGLENGQSFLKAAIEASRRKPVAVLKSGRSESGARAASSHTGSIAGSDAVYEAAFKKANVIRIDELDELFDVINIFSRMPLISRDGIAIISNAGGLGVMAADACSVYDIDLASLSRETIEELQRRIPGLASSLNPVDVRGDATAQMFEDAMDIVSRDPSVNGLIILSSPVDTVDLEAVAAVVVDFGREMPIAVSFPGGDKCDKALRIIRDGGVPDFPSPERAVRAMAHMLRYSERSSKSEGEALQDIEADSEAARRVIDVALSEGRDNLSEEEGKAMLRAYGIPVPPEGSAISSSEAVEIAEKIGYPVVMKVISPDIHHKTDIGGVIVGVKDEQGVREAFSLLQERARIAFPGAKVEGVSVQRMVKGSEVIVSMIRDETFGPVISYGMGGIFVEILREVSQKILPLTRQEVDELIRSNRAYQLLSGARGRPPGDVSSLADIIIRVAKMAMDLNEVQELEINPVMVGAMNEGSWAVDALVTLRRTDQ